MMPPGAKAIGDEEWSKLDAFWQLRRVEIGLPTDPTAPDEGRIAWNDPRIGFDWTIQNI